MGIYKSEDRELNSEVGMGKWERAERREHGAWRKGRKQKAKYMHSTFDRL